MGRQAYFLGRILILALLACTTSAAGQQAEKAPENTAPKKKVFEEQAAKNKTVPCIEPEPMVSLEDYTGPLKKTIGVFARGLELKVVHSPRYKPGTLLCSLELKDKFKLFVEDAVEPVTFMSAGFWAGMDQASDRDPTFGQGAAGYGKRFAANYADQASSKFFKDFAYSAIFSEDPRYYRLARGSGGRRFLHAVSHVFVAHRSDGTHMPNYSEWLGTVSAVTLSNTYHPGNQRGVGPAATRVGYSVLQDVGFDVLREFWPEISRKFRLPFRGEKTAAK